MQVLAGLKRTDGWLTKDACTESLGQNTKIYLKIDMFLQSL